MTESLKEKLDRYRKLYEANSHEVSRLSEVVRSQAEQIHHMGKSLNKWEERFDRLLEIQR